MKVKQDQLERLAGQLLARFQAKELVRLRTTEAEAKAKIIAVVFRNFAEEEEIEEEARKVLASHVQEAKGMDPYRMFLIAKQKLAAKKGFIL